ncbi:MAG: CopG family transcriptional regulator [Raoultibacter sp.]
MAAPYESGDFPHEEGIVYSRSHLDAVGKKRVTVVYDASDTVQVATIARKRGIKPSEVYRDAMRAYLDTQKHQPA